MKNYRALLIGNGTMGHRHKTRFESQGVCFFQVLDIAEGWNGDVFDLDLKNVDFVVIASPAVSHYAYAKYFLEHSIPVFVEKPLATNANEARELVKLAVEYNITLFVAQSECFNPLFLNFRKHFLQDLKQAAEQHSRSEVNGELCGTQDSKNDCDLKAHLEFRREHEYSNRCRDVDVSLDLLVHDLSLFFTMFKYDDVQIVANNRTADRATMTLKIVQGPFAGITADFIADRNSQNDLRTISVDFDGRNGSSYTVSLVHYTQSGSVAHIPDSLDNEHQFFLKLLAGACGEWGLRAASTAADVVELATRELALK